MDLLPKRLKKKCRCQEDSTMSIKKCQQHNSNLRSENSIDFKPVALATQAHQHLLKKLFNFINNGQLDLFFC